MIRLKVKEIAASRGISQRKLSIHSEVDIKTIQKIYRYPTSIVTTETLDKLAKVLDVDASKLIESIPDETSPQKPTDHKAQPGNKASEQ